MQYCIPNRRTPVFNDELNIFLVFITILRKIFVYNLLLSSLINYRKKITLSGVYAYLKKVEKNEKQFVQIFKINSSLLKNVIYV